MNLEKIKVDIIIPTFEQEDYTVNSTMDIVL